MSDSNLRILILADSADGGHEAPAKLLSKHYKIEQFTDTDKALEALGENEYEAVLASTKDFLPLERGLVQEKSNLILNTIGEGVCLINPDGKCVWANKKMKGFSNAAQEQVKRICIQAISIFSHKRNLTSRPSPASEKATKSANAIDKEQEKIHSKKFAFQANDQFFELICSPVLNNAGDIKQVVAVVWDASDTRRQQSKLDAIDASGSELARIGTDSVAKLSPPQRLQFLQDKIIKYSKDLMHFDHFAVRLLDRKSRKLEVVISEGLPESALEIDIYAQPQGNGISGYVAATGRSYICHDTEKDARYVPGLHHSKSSLTVPLMLFDEVIGVYNVESKQIGTFSEDDRQFAEIFGRHVAMALNILDLLVIERFTTSGQVSDSVLQEMAKPLNDMETELGEIKENCLDNNSAQDGLEHIAKYIEDIREAMKNVAAGPSTVLGEASGQQEKDPLLTDKKILIADDDPNIRKTIGDVLSKSGSQVTLCKDGNKACDYLRKQPFDLVISDIKMPYRNGYEIFAAAQRACRGLPVVLMTGFGYDPNHSIVRASQEGLSCVLYKPFKIDQLIEELHKAIKNQADNQND